LLQRSAALTNLPGDCFKIKRYIFVFFEPKKLHNCIYVI